ncbi:NAD(P)H-dependent oxidoreductase [Streptomyces sp. NBC_00237]|uniref:NADPH-dependent FMN reductase n=1 Tax=Streptomyces sp. NBC_00237 TaxID=2975687 RepID=UPI002255A4C8|nr:NAD(P)H-dependent oxidoreductase [Streptomyces sp. NBC_00237]MCX5203218.1 NAD(P)H-dependent oxidoreductase [Streptomyces sp. NBC_00237]
MQENPIKLAVIIGSVRGGRFGPTVAHWFVEQAKKSGDFTVDLIDLIDFPLPLEMPAFGVEPEGETKAVSDRLSARLHEADAFVVVTPEYNHTVSPALKNAIDWFLEEWSFKPVGLVSYGGMGGGLRAAEHLRQVFAEVHATTVRDMLSFHNAWGDFEKDGQPASPAGSEDAAVNLLKQVAWWADALREARTKGTYKLR